MRVAASLFAQTLLGLSPPRSESPLPSLAYPAWQEGLQPASLVTGEPLAGCSVLCSPQKLGRAVVGQRGGCSGRSS